MDITADSVKKKCNGLQLIEQEINSLLKTFKAEITEASKNGNTSVIIPVPTNFNIINMQNKTAQTIIYHRLIEECEDKGFNVRLSMDEASVTYCIRWDIKKEEYNLNSMRNKIASHMVKPK